MKQAILTATVLFFTCHAFSQNQDAKSKGFYAINENMVKAQMNILASDWTEGRETGSKGIDIAADYIASMYQYIGLDNLDAIQQGTNRDKRLGMPMNKGFFQDFALLRPISDDNHTLQLISKNSSESIDFQFNIDFSLYGRSLSSISGEFPYVFAGYGLNSEDHNSYKGIDAKGKVVIVLDGYPGWSDTSSDLGKQFYPGKSNWALYNLNKTKMNLAQNEGAKAVVIISGNGNILLNKQANVFRYKTRDYEGDDPPKTGAQNRMILPSEDLNSSLLTYMGSIRFLRTILDDPDFNILSFDEKLLGGNKLELKAKPNMRLKIRSNPKFEPLNARNVIAVIPGEDDSEVVIVGAHYDHMGKYQGRVWNGADDNASGTVAVMTLAKAFKESGIQAKKTIVFAAWSAEEKGLLGSRYFIENFPSAKVRFYMNLDMIGRDNDNDTLKNVAKMVYTKAYPQLREINKKHIDAFNIDLKMNYSAQRKPGGGSDHSSFSNKNIPVSYFMAGWHDDYHTADDELNKINYTKMTNIIRVAYLDIWNIANSEEFAPVNDTSD